MEIALVFVVVVGVVMGLVLCLPKLANRIGLVDEPDSRKHHQGSVPLVGGLAMYCGLVAGMSLLYADPWSSYPALLLGGAVLVVVGMLDDLLELRKRVRLPAQLVAALLMCSLSGIVLRDLGWLAFGEVLTLGVLAVPFTLFCTVGVVNAVNMSDGLDGLAGGLTVITLGALAYLAYDGGAVESLDTLMVLMASVLGFLAFNARSPWCRKAKVFMGDAGSMFLGFAIARFLIDFSQGDARIMHPVTALWIFAVPLMDTVAVMLRRIWARQSPFAADRQHLHHVLLAAGFSVAQTAVLIWTLALLLALVGIIGHIWGLPDGVMLAGFLGVFSIYAWSLSHLGKAARASRPVTAPMLDSAETSAAESSGRV